ncbi:MAG: hypothetical protein SFU56_16640 [Capsulimonadales bacterium]|nr:hypothetical protein [Capsulimonadales bacterium]
MKCSTQWGFVLAMHFVVGVPGILPNSEQNPPTVLKTPSAGRSLSLRQANEGPFHTRLMELSRRTGCLVVTEGEPCFSDQAEFGNALREFDTLMGQGPADAETIDKAVACLDYSVERKPDRLLLRKRYSRYEDIPEVTFPEYRRSLREMITIFRKKDLLETIVYQKFITDFQTMIRPEQWKQISDPGRQNPRGYEEWDGIPIAQLDTGQADHLFDMVRYEQFGTNLDQMEYVGDLIQSVTRRTTEFGRFMVNNREVTGIRLSLPSRQRIHVFGLESNSANHPDLFITVRVSGEKADKDEYLADFLHIDVDEVKKLRRSYFNRPVGPLAREAVTFSKLVRDANSGTSETTLLEEDLGGKRLCWASAAPVESGKLLDAAAAVFSLDRRRDADGQWKIGYPKTTFPRRLEDISEAISDLIPEAYQRAVRQRREHLPPGAIERQLGANLPEKAKEQIRKMDARVNRPMVTDRFVAFARERLKALIERRLKLQPENRPSGAPRIRFDDLSEEETRLLGILFFGRCFDGLEAASKPLPASVSRFKEGKVRFYPSESAESRKLNLELRFPIGDGLVEEICVRGR